MLELNNSEFRHLWEMKNGPKICRETVKKLKLSYTLSTSTAPFDNRVSFDSDWIIVY